MISIKNSIARLCGSVAFVCLSTSAFAEDAGPRWEGFYGGGYLGASFFNMEMSDLTDTFTNDAPNISKIVGAAGIGLGYNWVPRDDNFIIGVELDVQGGNRTDELIRFDPTGTDGQLYENSIDSLAALRAKVGVASGNILSYLTAGPTFANVTYSVTDLDPSIPAGNCNTAGIICAKASDSLIGIAVGFGLEYAIRDDRSVKFEVMHYMLPTASSEILNGGTTPVCSTADADECSAFFESSVTQVRVGYNFKF